jgi:hypothetical protein
MVQRWLDNEPLSVNAPVDADTAVEIGDLLYWDSDSLAAYPASDQPDQGDQGANQALFSLNFLGVALTAKPAGSGGTVRVATAADFFFLCPAGEYDLGTALGPAENDAGNALQNQTLTTVEYPEHAIAHVAQRAEPESTTVRVRIRSPLFP